MRAWVSCQVASSTAAISASTMNILTTDESQADGALIREWKLCQVEHTLWFA